MSNTYFPAGRSLPPHDPVWGRYLAIHAGVTAFLQSKHARISTYQQAGGQVSRGYYLLPSEYTALKSLVVRYVARDSITYRQAWHEQRDPADDRLMLEAVTALWRLLVAAHWSARLVPGNQSPEQYMPHVLVENLPIQEEPTHD